MVDARAHREPSNQRVQEIGLAVGCLHDGKRALARNAVADMRHEHSPQKVSLRRGGSYALEQEKDRLFVREFTDDVPLIDSVRHKPVLLDLRDVRTPWDASLFEAHDPTSMPTSMSSNEKSAE